MNIIITGLPRSGKSTLFNALTGSKKQMIYTESRFGTVKIPDEKLTSLSEWFKSSKTVFSELNITDPATSLNFESSDDFLNSKNVQQIQNFDGVVLVIRSFKNDSVSHPYGEIDHYRDLEQFVIESRLIDVQILEKRIENIKNNLKSLNKQNIENQKGKIKLLTEIIDLIQKGKINETPKNIFHDIFLLSKAPVLIIINTDEDTEFTENELTKFKTMIGNNSNIVTMSLEIEDELAKLDKKEAVAIRKELSLKSTELEAIFDKILDISNTICFLTGNLKECKSWQINNGITAIEAASRIHSDISRGFIRAEITNWGKLISCNNEKEAKEKGFTKREGKDYILKDGDVVNFLFSV